MSYAPALTAIFLSLSLFYTNARAQLSGVINSYAQVTAVDYVCNTLTVNSTTGFAAGDQVMVIQMQGASMDQTNSSTFGDLSSIGYAGNYELNTIDHFNGNIVYLSKTLLRNYAPSGAVQMVNVPQYGDVSVDGELTAKSWDGSTGGVIAFQSSGTITLNANINASAQGFRGGDKSSTGGDCYTSSNNTYYYAYPTVQAGQKGQGIAAYVSGKESGRGKQTNGGGGGNSHNTGGGGGGNYGAGGRGGDRLNTCTLAPSPYGYGGIALNTYYNTTNNKLFMGGGGGGGQQNNNLSYNAGNGGGIVYLKASALTGNGDSILSNGGSVSYFHGDNGDGNSGGGAGGTIVLDIGNMNSPLTVQANGGQGGDTRYPSKNFGPGGGGGGGVIWYSGSSSPAAVVNTVNGGASGISRNGATDADPGTPYNATNGDNGAVLTGLVVPASTSASSCALPVELLFFNAQVVKDASIQLQWATAKEENNLYFTLEKSNDGISFETLTKIYGQKKSEVLESYSFIDQHPFNKVNYYRLWQTDLDGHTTNLGIRKVYSTENPIVVTVYPNPFDNYFVLHFENNVESPLVARLYNALGEEVVVTPYKEDERTFRWSTEQLNEGWYILYYQVNAQWQHLKLSCLKK